MAFDPNEVELGALRRILQLSRGTFTLTTVVCNTPVQRTAICERLKSEGLQFSEVHLPIDSFDPVASVRQLITDTDDRAIFVVGLDYLLAESTPGSELLLNVFNRSRERWKAAFPQQAVFFWLTSHTSVRVLTHARTSAPGLVMNLNSSQYLMLLDRSSLRQRSPVATTHGCRI